ncbi:hypothetical protein [Flagellimonas myxillae]|uniref:hypothetical protein n=1 Tax=Flagellimonas myxillae TaxID=2942214 RepID=UPI00201EBD77|nr:hypothetical protein [Muricauda myxillae]MCL6266151.1 hypothetical protein [Muricauda myxillae]
MGGKQLWNQTNFLYLKEKMWTKETDSIDMEIWLDLTKPKTKIKLKNDSLNRVRAFTPNGGWGQLEDGSIYQFDSLRLKQEIENWKRTLYSICKRIALKNHGLSFKLRDDGGLEIFEGNMELLCIIEFNHEGRPIKWQMKSEFGNDVSIYGPLASFGKFSLPKWRTSLDGHWQFEYLEVIGYPKVPDISFDLAE